jgi:hypothetical protein
MVVSASGSDFKLSHGVAAAARLATNKKGAIMSFLHYTAGKPVSQARGRQTDSKSASKKHDD